MEFVETSIFTRDVNNLLSQEEQRELQKALLVNPQAGDMIEGTGGIRKMRFGAGNKGKRGGVRTIYYHHQGRQIIFLLVIYPKGRKDNLTAKQKKSLRALVEKEFN